MFKKGIARRWLFNSLGVMILLFTACIAALSFVVQSYAYNGIQMTLIGRSDELPTVLSGSMKTVSEFNAAARSYTENFPDKDLMEVMAVSRSGSILSTSSGFAPDQNQSKPDFESALHSENGYGYWIGKLASGEKVMAVSRVARGANGAVLGAVRYIVSMERADRQITYVVLVLIGIGVLILVLVTLSGISCGLLSRPFGNSMLRRKKLQRAILTCASRKRRTTSSAHCATPSTTWRQSLAQRKK